MDPILLPWKARQLAHYSLKDCPFLQDKVRLVTPKLAGPTYGRDYQSKFTECSVRKRVQRTAAESGRERDRSRFDYRESLSMIPNTSSRVVVDSSKD